MEIALGQVHDLDHFAEGVLVLLQSKFHEAVSLDDIREVLGGIHPEIIKILHWSAEVQQFIEVGIQPFHRIRHDLAHRAVSDWDFCGVSRHSSRRFGQCLCTQCFLCGVNGQIHGQCLESLKSLCCNFDHGEHAVAG